MFKKESFIRRIAKNRLSLAVVLSLVFVLVVFSIYEMPFGTGTAGQDTITLIFMWVSSLVGGGLLVIFIQLFITPELENYFLERLTSHVISVSVLYIWVLFVVLMTFPKYTLTDFTLFLEVLLYYTLVGTPVEVIRYFEQKMWKFTSNPDNPEKVIHTLCDLNKDLPIALQESPIWSLTADDHYIQIQTEKERHMALMRLSDAIDKTSHIDGVRVHRSHWVAKQGIKEIKRKNGRMSCILHNDTIIPISRTGQSEIRKAGWLK